MLNLILGQTLLAIYIFTHLKKTFIAYIACIVLNMFKRKAKIYEE